MTLVPTKKKQPISTINSKWQLPQPVWSKNISIVKSHIAERNQLLMDARNAMTITHNQVQTLQQEATQHQADLQAAIDAQPAAEDTITDRDTQITDLRNQRLLKKWPLPHSNYSKCQIDIRMLEIKLLNSKVKRKQQELKYNRWPYDLKTIIKSMPNRKIKLGPSITTYNKQNAT